MVVLNQIKSFNNGLKFFEVAEVVSRISEVSERGKTSEVSIGPMALASDE
jgi:hypothetical protein